MKKLIGLILGIALSVSFGAEKPNVILILADDLGWGDVGFNGSEQVPTPNLDRIAKGGVVFPRAYATHPYCGPSRAGLLTGRFQQRFGVIINPPFAPANPEVGLPDEEKTIADHLKTVGYQTAIIGKWHLGAAESKNPISRGFDYFYGMIGGGGDYFPAKNNPPADVAWGRPDRYVGYKLPLYRDRKPEQPPEGYLTDILTDDAVSYINNAADPFFLFLSYNAPHTPLQAKEVDLKKFAHIEDEKRRTVVAMISCMDEGIGRVVEALEDKGIRDNTLVIFSSDNGGKRPWGTSGPFRDGKGSPYEGGTRVPLIFNWPDRIEAGTFEKAVSLLDICATLTEINGVKADSERPLDGVNLLPYLDGKDTSVPYPAHYAKRYYGTPDSGIWSYQNKDMKIVMTKRGGTGTPLLFNLKNDVGEKRNIASAHPEIVQNLLKEVKEWESQHIMPTWGFEEDTKNYLLSEDDRKKQRAAFESGQTE